MNEDLKRERRKKETAMIILICYIIISAIIIRIGIIVNAGYSLNAEIIDIAIKSIFKKPFIFPNSTEELKYFFMFSIGYGIFALNILSKKEKYMHGKEYGSAEFAKPKDLDKFRDKKFDNNIILSNTEHFSINDKKIMRNLNVLIIGGSGTGKTRFFVKPNLMQMHSSYVITDPKGEILRDTGKMLADNGYKIKVFDLYNMKDSHKYNPFAYLKNETDVLKLINNLIKNTNPAGSTGGGDPFWEKSETALLQSLISFIWKYIDEEEQCISTVLRLMEKIEIKEDDENFKSEMDIIMEYYNELDPNNFSYQQWLIFKQAGGKTAKSIVISAGVRLSVFNIKDLAEITSQDEMKLEEVGSEKTALFILISDSDSTFNFLVSMLYQQLFDVLYYEADFKNNGRLKVPVRCIIDEFANIGQIPEFEKKLSTMRSRGISSNIIIQNTAQLEALYKDHWKTIIGNCDSMLYLGGIEQSSHEYISKLLGKATIDNKTRGISRGRSGSSSQNFQRLGRELLTPDEVAKMDNKNCIVIFRGLKPFFSEKFKLEKHKRYPLLFEGKNENNIFIFKEYKDNIAKLEETRPISEITPIKQEEGTDKLEAEIKRIEKQLELIQNDKKEISKIFQETNLNTI